MTYERMVELFERDEVPEGAPYTIPSHEVPGMDSKFEAMLLLHCILPGSGNLAGAEHDEVYLTADLEALAEVITEADINALMHRGVMCDGDGLSMFV